MLLFIHHYSIFLACEDERKHVQDILKYFHNADLRKLIELPPTENLSFLC